MTVRIGILFFIAMFSILPVTSGNEEGKSADTTYDVVVYGGTSAAVTAAVQTKAMGHSVVIVSPDIHLGGLSNGGLGETDSGNKSAIGGLSLEFYHRIWRWYSLEEAGKTPDLDFLMSDQESKWTRAETKWKFEPHVAETVFESFVKQYEIPVFRNQWLDRDKGVEKKDGRIIAITTLSGQRYSGRYFLDATYEGDLMAVAGVPWTTGREANSQYNETLNGVQTQHAKYHQFRGFVDPYIEPGNPKSGLLPYVNEKLEGQDGDGDTKIQAYNLRLCLTNIPENRVTITKPEPYNELDYELLFRAIEAGQTDFFIMSTMPNSKTDSNNYDGFSSDLIGGNYDYPNASYEERAKIYERHRLWCHGLLWTLANHPRVPERMHKQWSAWGLAKDEFVDNNHWPHQLYVREARRMLGDFVETERHIRLIDEVEQPVGMGSYQMDSHNVQRYVDYDMFGKPSVRNEGDVEVGVLEPYPIDYRAMLPKRSAADNLLVPVCISSTHIAFGSIRMEPVFMILGQSAATAVCLALDGNTNPHDLEYAVLAKRLADDGQVLALEGNVPLSQLEGQVIEVEKAELTGEWVPGNIMRPFVGRRYFYDNNTDKGAKSVTFRFQIPSPGRYECRLAYSTHVNRATNVPVCIKTERETRELKINQRQEAPIDGLFISCGVVEADKEIEITVSNTDTFGQVILDAAQVIPVAQ
ncbi:MAG: FAD-dependent oxidoreductase [Planctomycetia bacterium]|nr:FAD-dependent oxidoreductase [Planctomycetia bacterium]